MTYELVLGDAMQILPTLEAGSIDAIITDLPYGTTACAWDEVIPFAPMWEQVRRLLKPRGVFVTTASQPFTSALVMSNLKWFRYCWYWHKNNPVGFQVAKNQPMRAAEEIAVFYEHQPIYNPQMRKTSISDRRVSNGMSNGGAHYSKLYQTVTYKHPLNEDVYPHSVLEFDVVPRATGTVHPTQKPVALYAYLIRTYTNPGDTVLDFCAGSGTTGVAAIKEGRHFIGVELDADYHAIAQKRIADAAAQPMLLDVTA